MKLHQHRAELAFRVGVLNGVTLVVVALILVSYWFVQVAEGSSYRELADNNRLRKLSLEAPRGLIRDRHGRPLVENVPSYALLLDRSRSRDLDASIDFAASILDRPREELAEALSASRQTPSFQPLLLAEELSMEQVAQFSVEHLEHPEFEIDVKHVRLYRHAHQTAHILGYLGEATEADVARPESRYRAGDAVGKKGIESLYEERLRGARGEQVVVVDSRGRLIEEYDHVPAVSGHDLTLTIDLDLQQEAARQLSDKVGAIVALDPRQGEVLAIASSPSFNPNHFARRLRPNEWQELIDNPDRPLQNRALQNTYPPGSVFKIVMALAGLERGLVTPETPTVWCPGYSQIYNNRYRCWKPSGHGRVNLRNSLKFSCNVYYHQLGQKLGIDQIAETARRFGFGTPTGIDLTGEKSGLVPDNRWSLKRRGAPWYPGETISVATGQGPILVTPLQIAVMVAAVANGGRLVQPHLVQTGEPVAASAIKVSPTHLDLVRDALWSVVNEPGGTAGSAHVEGLDIAGKTGTAQVITQERRTDNSALAPEHRDHAWFASFAPVSDPRLVVVVFVEHGGGGSKAAAPLAKALYEKHFAR